MDGGVKSKHLFLHKILAGTLQSATNLLFCSWNRHLANPWNGSSRAMRDKRCTARSGGVLGWRFEASFELIKDEALVPSKRKHIKSADWNGIGLRRMSGFFDIFWWLCQEGKKKTIKFPDLSTFRWFPKGRRGRNCTSCLWKTSSESQFFGFCGFRFLVVWPYVSGFMSLPLQEA